MLALAGDIGGTNTRLALYDGLVALFERTYPSASFPSVEGVIAAFFGDARRHLGRELRPDEACLAIAGPVDEGTARLTNLPWRVDARSIEEGSRIPHVALVNDFHAAALGVSLLGSEQFLPVGGGVRVPDAPLVVTGPGTGLGVVFVIPTPGGAPRVLPSEGGHVDFAPRTPLEVALLEHLAARYGRVSYERVLSGPGLRDLIAFLMADPALRGLARDETRDAAALEDAAAVVVRQALAGRDPLCVLALDLFIAVLGAFAGNLALTVLARGGVFIAGGIAPRIATRIATGPFRQAFEDKGRLGPLLQTVPVFVTLEPRVGLLGAAALARARAAS